MLQSSFLQFYLNLDEIMLVDTISQDYQSRKHIEIALMKQRLGNGECVYGVVDIVLRNN